MGEQSAAQDALGRRLSVRAEVLEARDLSFNSPRELDLDLGENLQRIFLKDFYFIFGAQELQAIDHR